MAVSIVYRIAQNFGGVKLWRIDRFRVLVGGNVGEFTIVNIATLVNLEFGGVKYWRMVFGSPNKPKFSPAKILRYTVIYSTLMWHQFKHASYYIYN